MKKQNMLDAMGGVDPAFIVEAAPDSKAVPVAKVHTKKHVWHKLKIPTAVTAALLAIAILLGVFGGDWLPWHTPQGDDPQQPDNGIVAPQAKNYALFAAQYPQQAQYPGYYVGSSLDPEYPAWDAKYDAWRAQTLARRQFRGAGTDLKPFFAKTIAEFLSDTNNENRVYSPLNVYMALAMLAEVTDGESREEILALLGADSIEALRTQVYRVWNASYRDDGKAVSVLANSVWLDEDLQYRADALERLATDYYASTFQGEMGSDAYNQALQNWLNEQTGGLLQDYINDLEMNPQTVLALASTVYYKSAWYDQYFYEPATQNQVFHGATGDVSVPFMRTGFSEKTTFWGDLFCSISLSLEEGGISFLLPDEGVSVNDLLSNEQALAYIVGADSGVEGYTSKVKFRLPKFDVQSKMDLIDGLENLGVTQCFTQGTADFSPILGESTGAFLNKIEHGARVAIDEQGCVGAAYTIEVLNGSAPPKELELVEIVLDRPFVFVIKNSDGLPLFVGVVNQVG